MRRGSYKHLPPASQWQRKTGKGLSFKTALVMDPNKNFSHSRMSIRPHDEQAGVPLSNLFKNRLTHRIHWPQGMRHGVDRVEPQEFNCPFSLPGGLFTILVRAENTDLFFQV